MLARESKVPPGFSGAVRVFYQGEVSGFHLTTLQLSGSSRFLITHTLGGVFELNISPSGIIFPTSFWNGQREQEYTFIYDLDKNLHGHRGRMKYLFGVWSLIWTSRACFFFFGSRIILQQNHPWDTIIREVLAESDIFWPGNILSTLLRSSIYC